MAKTRAQVQRARAWRTGTVRLQIPDGRASPCPAQAHGTEKFLPTLLCQELDSRIILLGRAAKVQCHPGMQEGKEATRKACSESLEGFFFVFLGFFFWSFEFFSRAGSALQASSLSVGSGVYISFLVGKFKTFFLKICVYVCICVCTLLCY